MFFSFRSRDKILIGVILIEGFGNFGLEVTKMSAPAFKFRTFCMQVTDLPHNKGSSHLQLPKYPSLIKNLAMEITWCKITYLVKFLYRLLITLLKCFVNRLQLMGYRLKDQRAEQGGGIKSYLPGKHGSLL